MEDLATTVTIDNATANGDESLTASWYPSLIAIFTIQTLTIVTGNTLTAYIYWTSPSLQKSLHNLLICNLSVADLLVALTGTPFYLITYTEAGIEYISSKYECLSVMMSINISVNISLAAITILCLERFVAVIYPYKYYTIVTERSIRVVVTLSYIFSIVSATPPLLGWNNWEIGLSCRAVYAHPKEMIAFFGILRSVIIIATILMNVTIAKVAFTKNRTSIAHFAEEGQVNESLNSSYNVTKMLLTVFGVYYVCWMPFIITTVMYRENTNRSIAFIICHDISKILVGLNSCINPLIYLKGNTQFREAFKKSLHRLFPQQQD